MTQGPVNEPTKLQVPDEVFGRDHKVMPSTCPQQVSTCQNVQQLTNNAKMRKLELQNLSFQRTFNDKVEQRLKQIIFDGNEDQTKSNDEEDLEVDELPKQLVAADRRGQSPSKLGPCMRAIEG